MKKIMILGAGTYQVPLIMTARRMGLYTIVVSIGGEYRGFDYADKVYEIDTRDQEKVLEAAKKEHIDGICTSGTDVAVSTIGYVCEQMGLSGIPLKAARILTDKALMKEHFMAQGVAAARGMRACSLTDVKDAAGKIGYPLVVKRVDSSGSRGITIVKDASKLKDAYECAAGKTTKKYVLVEEYIGAEEIGVDGFVQNGRLVFMAPHGKFVYRGENTTIPIGHTFPYKCSEQLENEIHRQMQLAVTAAGADQCFVNADVFVQGDKAYIIELGGRTGATCIPELISMHYGFDFYEKIILSALDEEVEFLKKEGSPCMAKLLMSPISGRITAVDWAGVAELEKSGAEVAVDYLVGSRVYGMSDGTDRIGHVIAAVNKEEELDELIHRAYACIWIEGKSLEELWKK